MSNFLQGIYVFFQAFKACIDKNKLFNWYSKLAVKSVVIALVLLLVLMVAGGFGIKALVFTLITDALWAPIATVLLNILWILAVIYFAGTICSTILIASIGLIIDEDTITECFSGECKKLQGKKSIVVDRAKEVWIIFRSVIISIATIPLFFFPWMIPLAIFLNAWAMGWESLSMSKRLWHQHGYESLDDDKDFRFPMMYVAGIGFITSLLLMIPVIGWISIPILQVAGVMSNKSKLASSK